jgi:hypothetical protein
VQIYREVIVGFEIFGGIWWPLWPSPSSPPGGRSHALSGPPFVRDPAQHCVQFIRIDAVGVDDRLNNWIRQHVLERKLTVAFHCITPGYLGGNPWGLKQFLIVPLIPADIRSSTSAGSGPVRQKVMAF